MSEIIISKILEITETIQKEGYEINGTKEVNSIQTLKIDVTKIDFIQEENSIRDYYTQRQINTQAIRSLEHNLYEFIYHGLKQSIEQTLYFDKTQDFTSRRFTFSTTDCISHVQLLCRLHETNLIMHIRSTDVIKLLPWDFLFACKLIHRILSNCGFPPTEKKYVNIHIGSAHYYLKSPVIY